MTARIGESIQNYEIVNAAMNDPEVKKHLDQEMVQTKAMTPDEMTAFMQAEVDKWVPAVRKTIDVK